ncbi:MAG: hypothetical protein VR73_08050 [Gammaproteobacteria bacterium BRH_c0]|nr:MAG: hypothetical protein VR73_08050 [Gammaproteobacteria bacterium BRH_c0]
MSVKKLDHVNIRTARLPECIEFYGTALGMSVVPPPMTTDLSKGAYCLDEEGLPVVHLVATGLFVEGADPVRGAAQRGMIDHFALSCSGNAEDYSQRLRQHHLDFDEMDVPAIGMHLIFVRDPNGVLVELGFPL